jgi:hypothetical protein
MHYLEVGVDLVLECAAPDRVAALARARRIAALDDETLHVATHKHPHTRTESERKRDRERETHTSVRL